MPAYTRHLDETERAQRQAYLVVHPGQEGVLMPTVAGFPEVADWLDAGSPPAGACHCYVCAQAAAAQAAPG